MNKTLIICVNRRLTPTTRSCAMRGSFELAERLEQRIAQEQLGITVQKLFCLGHCDDGPVLRLAPGGEFLLGMEEEEIMARLRAFAAVDSQPA